MKSPKISLLKTIISSYDEFLQIVYCQQIFNNIQKSCLETICLEPKILFNSVNFIELPASLLEIILKRDDLNLDERKLKFKKYDHVLCEDCNQEIENFGYKGEEIKAIFEEANKEIPNISISHEKVLHASQVLTFDNLPKPVNSSAINSYLEEDMNNEGIVYLFNIFNHIIM